VAEGLDPEEHEFDVSVPPAVKTVTSSKFCHFQVLLIACISTYGYEMRY
jgi:hypothetical protein